jgi:hypothetical protein
MNLILSLLLLLSPLRAGAETSLHTFLQKIEEETGYRMLYRDALVAGKQAGAEFDENWKETLLETLQKNGLEAVINNERRQIVIFQRKESTAQVRSVMGYVIDRNSGEQLPFATVRWQQEGAPSKGTQSDLRGRFTIPDVRTNIPLNLVVSYVGFHRAELMIDEEGLMELDELAVRIEPSPFEITEIVVSGNALSQSRADSVYRGMLESGTFAPLGEPNTIRMLQALPAVSHGASLMDGSYVRGSNSDAMHVLLDGTVIYNQSHLFGLIDTFNADVIRTGSFYYDVAPARYQAPPGGVLDLVTKTGSLHNFGGSFGLSNSVIRGSAEGPLSSGRASWLIAGRHSILNQVNIFDNSGMVAWGLNIDRKTSRPEGAFTLEERVVTPLGYSVNFYDLHGKVYLDNGDRGRWTFSGYLGGDRTSQEAERLVRTSLDQSLRRFETGIFETANRWGNRSFSASHFHEAGGGWSVQVNAGYSYYYTRYLKEDFVYLRPGQNSDSPAFLCQ